MQTLATAAYGGRRNIWFDVKLDSTGSVWVDGERIFNQVPGANPDLAPMGRVGLITHWAPGKFDDVWFDHGTFTPCSETFSNNNVPEVASGTWNVSGGTLNGTSVNASSIALPCNGSGNVTGVDAGTDFVYSARLLNQYGASGNLVGLIFNLGAGDYYELVFSPTGSGFLNKFVQGVRSSVRTFPHNVPSNTWFDVQLFRSGINTTVKVNGVTVISDLPQGELRGGRVGVVTHWAKARFDDVSLLPHVVRSAPVAYTLTHIATFPPDDPSTGMSNVFDLNDVGEVAGTRPGPTGQQAFTWRDGTFRNLNPLFPTGNRGGLAFALNNQSDVAGDYRNLQFEDRPFLLSGTGQLIPLTNIPAAPTHVLDLNDRREVLFVQFIPNAAPHSIWRSGQLTPLQALPGSTGVNAVAINNQGVVTGYATMPNFNFTPVLWQGGTVMPISIPQGSQTARSVALNDHDAVAATATFFDSGTTRTQGYIWHEGEVTLLLPPDPALSSQPRDINNRGVVVGFSFNISGSGGDTPTVWDGPRGQDLNTLISRQDPLQPFVRLRVAAHNNNRGQIVAHGVDARQPAGMVSWYLLTPVTTQ